MHLNWLAHSMLQAQSYVNCVLNKMHLRFQIHFKHYKILLGRPRGGTRGQLGAQGACGGVQGLQACTGCMGRRTAPSQRGNTVQMWHPHFSSNN